MHGSCVRGVIETWISCELKARKAVVVLVGYGKHGNEIESDDVRPSMRPKKKQYDIKT